MMNIAVAILIGVSGGLIVGGGIAAFFTVIGIVSRIIEIGKTSRYIYLYKLSVLSGVLISTLSYSLSLKFNLGSYVLVIIGFLAGVFVGMLASALAEVLDVIPVISARLNINRWIYVIIFAIIFGKIAGAIVYWLFLGLS